jgi:replicative DNA helicase
MGKSTLLAAISRNVAAQGYGVAEFALEMDEMEDGLRAASALAFDPSPRVASPHYLSAQRNVLTAPQWDAMRGSARAAAALHIHTDYRPGRTISQIEAAARRLFAKLRRSGVTPGLVVIDHEGLIAAEQGQRFGSQLERTNARAEALMALPKRLGVPIFVAGQLTKDGKRADGEERLPSGDDWKYGGALIEAAQAVLLVHRKAYYAERKPAHLRSPEDWDALKSRETTIVVDKARGGRRGQTTILMDMPTAAAWEAA